MWLEEHQCPFEFEIDTHHMLGCPWWVTTLWDKGRVRTSWTQCIDMAQSCPCSPPNKTGMSASPVFLVFCIQKKVLLTWRFCYCSTSRMLLLVFTIFLVLSVILQSVTLGFIMYLVYRVVEDKNAAVSFCKSVWWQLQNDAFQHLFRASQAEVDEKKQCIINK